MRRVGVTLLLLLVGGPVAQARVSANLVPNDPIYRHLDTLVASGLLDSLMLGQRPLARSDVARMVDEAKLRLPAFRERQMQAGGGFEITAQRMRHLNYVEAILDFLTTTLVGPPTHFHAHHHVTSLTGTLLSQHLRAIPATTPDGTLDAAVFPLTDHAGGREFRRDFTHALESQHQLQLGPALHLFLQPRLAVSFGSGSAQLLPEPQQAYLKTGLRHVELVIGREAIQWGPGYHGGLALSDHARPLDMVRVTTPLPIAVGPLGHLKATALCAYLHADVATPQTILSGYRIDLQPQRTLTVGWQHLVMLGGRGLRSPNAGQAMLAFAGLPFSGHDGVDANHTYAIDIAARIPHWRDMAVYLQLLIDDVDRRWSRTFDQQAAWLVGIQMPRATYDGGWDFRLEFTRTGAAAFRHGAYTSGWAVNGRLLGATAGPASEQLELMANRDTVLGSEVVLALRLTHRHGPSDEWASAALAQFRHPLSATIALHAAAGYEQVWNANLTPGATTSNALGELGLAVSY